MAITHFTELRAWQLASDSVCSNIAEGFGRYGHGEFARFVTIARGSLAETQDHLLNAKGRRYLEPQKFEELWSLSLETMRSVTRLLTYLRTTRAPREREGRGTQREHQALHPAPSTKHRT